MRRASWPTQVINVSTRYSINSGLCRFVRISYEFQPWRNSRQFCAKLPRTFNGFGMGMRLCILIGIATAAASSASPACICPSSAMVLCFYPTPDTM